MDFLKGVDWVATGNEPADGGLVATHEGVWRIGGVEIKCYRLNNGEAVVDADDFLKFFDVLSEQV